jgi:hypothetical protein
MTRRQSEGAEALSDEAQRKAIQAQIKVITEAKDAIQAAMRALPLDGMFRDPIIGEESLSLRADKYLEMAFASLAHRPPSAKNEVETQISVVNKKAAELLELLERLDPLAVDAIHLGMRELNFRPAIKRPMSSALIDPPPKAIGDIKGRLEVLIDASDIAESPVTAKDAKGRDQKGDALEIAKAAAADYLDLTGRSPKRSYKDSSFVDFLAAIFKALGRCDNPDNFAKKAIKWLDNDRVREDEDAIRKWMANPNESPPHFGVEE